MRRTACSIILIGTIILLAGGCMSMRTTTDLVPQTDSNLKSQAGRFYVANLRYLNNIPNANAAADSAARMEGSLLTLLRQECMERYPLLFADASETAIPLGVTVKVRTKVHNGQTIAWMLCTLTLSGLVFPCPGAAEEDLAVEAFVWNGQPGARGTGLQTNFQRESHSWVSLLTPLALIPVPGTSDFPKISGSAFATQKLEEDYSRQVAQQTATALARLVAEKDSAYWAAQPHEHILPGATTPGAGPTALPPPMGAAAPF